MARITVDRIEIEHALLGEPGRPAVVLTPGGRFAHDTPGLPELAARLVAGGRRVLLWDRPNCGASDISFDGDSESSLQADALIGLVRALELGPVTIAGGSAGSRVSLIAAARAPEMVSHLIVWWISGGPLSLAQLAAHYCGGSAMVAAHKGMAAVAALPEWAEQLAKNPRNRTILLAQDPTAFVARMQRWALAYAFSESSPVPGVTADAFARLTMPTLVFRSGASDTSHPRETSEWVHRLIPGAQLAEPPWGDQEWNERMFGQHEAGLFVNWPRLAPAILDFIGS